MMTTIALIRHGQTNWNLEGRIQGQIDIPLNEQGRAQAHTLAERLKSKDFDAMISSDLARAQETAEILADKTGIPTGCSWIFAHGDTVQVHAYPVRRSKQDAAAFVEAWILEQFRMPWQTPEQYERRVRLF